MAKSKLGGAVYRVRLQEDANPWERLANGIIAQAVTDYRESVLLVRRGKRKCPTTRIKMVAEIDHFFHSRWFTQLADLDGDTVLQEVRRQVDMEVSA